MSLYKAISVFDIAKLMLSEKFGRFSFRDLCINVDCYEDTYDVFTFVHNYYYSRYLHTKQYALNQTLIIINSKKHTIKTHYCCECFKNFVLVGDKDYEKIDVNYDIIDQVNITYY